MRSARISEANLSDYLYAVDAPHRNALIDQRRNFAAAYLDQGSGMSNADAAAIRARVVASGRQADYDRLAQMVRDILDRDLSRREAGGLISPAQAQAWRTLFGPTYVMWGGWEGEETATFSAGQRTGPRGPESKSALGRKSRAASAVTNAIGKAVYGIRRIEENRVRNDLHWLAVSDEGSATPTGAFTVLSIPPRREVLDKSTGLVVSILDRGYKGDPNVSASKIGGVERYVRINDENLAKAFNELIFHDPDDAYKYLAPLTRAYGWLRTIGNPFFAPKNFARDNLDAPIYAAAHIPNGLVRYEKNLPRAMAASSMYVWTGRESPQFRRFRLGGGKVSYAQVRNMDQLRKRFARSLKSNFHPGNILDMVKFPLEAWNDMFETGVRYAMYLAAIDAGLSHDKASNIALNSTLNFYKRGASRFLADMTASQPFLNASIQGPVRAGRLIRGSKIAAGAYTGFMALGFALGALNIFVGGDDDDEQPFFDKVAQHIRLRNMILYNPLGKKDRHGRPEGVMLPAFPEIMLPYTIGQSIAAAMFGKRKLGSIMGDVTHAIWNLNPLEGRSVGIPFVESLTEIYANKDRFENPIHPERNDQQRGVPASEIKRRRTDQAWQDVARGLAKLGGGDRREKPVKYLDLHPEDIRHIAKDLAGGWYNIAEYALHATGIKPNTRGAQHPIVKDFVLPGSAHDRYTQEQLDKRQGLANADRIELRDTFDPQSGSRAEVQRERAKNRVAIEQAGGVLGRRAGMHTPQTDIFDTSRHELQSLYRKLSVAENAPRPNQDQIDDLRFEINKVRKQYIKISDDLREGRRSYTEGENNVRRFLAQRRSILRNEPGGSFILEPQ